MGVLDNFNASQTKVGATATTTNTAAGGVVLNAPERIRIGGVRHGGTAGTFQSMYPNLQEINVGLTGEHAALFVREARGLVQEAKEAAADILEATPGSQGTATGNRRTLTLAALGIGAYFLFGRGG